MRHHYPVTIFEVLSSWDWFVYYVVSLCVCVSVRVFVCGLLRRGICSPETLCERRGPPGLQNNMPTRVALTLRVLRLARVSFYMKLINTLGPRIAEGVHAAYKPTKIP